MTRRGRLWVGLPFMVLGALVAIYFLSGGNTRPLDQAERQRLGGDYVRLSQGVTHYRLHGQGSKPLVVLVHGFSAGAFVWEHNWDALVKAGFRVLAYDQYGAGFSDRVAGDHSPAFYVRQLDDLLAALKIETPVDLVGLSMGGALVAIYTAQRPDKVRRVALVDPAGYPLPIPLTGRLARLPVLGDFIMRVLGRRELMSNVGKKAIFDQSQVPAFRKKFVRQLEYDGYLDGLLSTLRHFDLGGQRESFLALGKSGKPVLLLWGEEDQIIPPSNAQLIKTDVPQAGVRVIPKAGHMPNYETPQAFNPILVEFLAQGREG